MDTQRVYVTLWTAPHDEQGGKVGARWKARGLAVLQFDKSEPALDIMNPIVISTLRSWMARGLVAALFESPMCTSWSVASCRPNLRSNACPWGLSDLTRKCQAKVDLGNQEGRIALGFLEHSYQCDVPAALEHPGGSYLLKTDEFSNMQQTCDAALGKFNQCCFGAKWWNPTALVSVGSGAGNQWVCSLGKQCSRQDGVCDFTGLPHVKAKGRLCELSSIYPPSMSRKIADRLAAQAVM